MSYASDPENVKQLMFCNVLATFPTRTPKTHSLSRTPGVGNKQTKNQKYITPLRGHARGLGDVVPLRHARGLGDVVPLRFGIAACCCPPGENSNDIEHILCSLRDARRPICGEGLWNSRWKNMHLNL